MKHASSQTELPSVRQVLASHQREIERDAPERSAVSFLVSIAFHALLIWFLLHKLPGGGNGSQAANTGDNYRTLGVMEIESDLIETPQETVAENPPEQQQSTPAPNVSPEPIPLPGRSPKEKTERERTTEVIIPGIATPGTALTAETPGVRSTTTTGTSLIPTKDGVGFFGLGDSGKSVVYLIDSSWSMEDHKAIIAAKQQLRKSLRELSAQQQFQIIFYNSDVTPMTTSGGQPMVYATQLEITRADNFIARQRTGGGTRHFQALMTGLTYKPDLIFFLTDASEPPLSARQLSQIASSNRQQTKIHCIEFGNAPQTNDPGNFLKKVAAQNQGTYLYYDVRQFR